MSKVLMQTRAPLKVYRWVKKKAEIEGISVAAWLRRLLIQQYEQDLRSN